jgi:antitoxin YefM
MKAISYTTVRQNFAQTMDEVCQDHAPVIVTRKQNESVVIISLADYHAMEETAYLLRSPQNARRLLNAALELENQQGQERTLLE